MRRAVLITVLVAGLCGCAAPYTRRASIATGSGNQGQAWEVVLPGGEALRAEADSWETSRRDWVLVGPPGDDLPSDAWPAPAQPDLYWTYRLTLPNDANQVLYQRTGPAGSFWPVVRIWW